MAARCKAAPLLRLWVQIPPAGWMSVCCKCCVLSGRGLCDGPITRPEESCRLRCVVVCDLETSWMRKPWPDRGLSRQKTNKQTSIETTTVLRARKGVMRRFAELNVLGIAGTGKSFNHVAYILFPRLMFYSWENLTARIKPLWDTHY